MSLPLIWLPLNGHLYNIGSLIDKQAQQTNAVTFINEGPFGSCASITTSSNYIYIDSIPIGLNTTICCWVKPSVSNIFFIDMRANGSTGYQPFYWNSSSGIQVYSSYGGGTKWIQCPISMDTWQHLVMTIGVDNKVKLYKNGQYIGMAEGIISNNHTANLTIGNRGSRDRATGLQIADVRIYNEVLTPLEVEKIYMDKGLMLHYSGTNYSNSDIIKDLSGNKHYGEITSGLTFVNDSSSRYGSCFNISTNAADVHFVENGEMTNLISSMHYTWSFWVNPTGENGARSTYIGTYTASIRTGFNLEKNANNQLRIWIAGKNGNPDYAVSGTSLTDNKWTHVAVTYNGTQFKIYINGVLKDTKSYVTGEANWTDKKTWRFGRDGRTTTEAYQGKMADIRCYVRTLTDKEIMLLANSPLMINKEGKGIGFSFKENTNCNFIRKNGIIEVDEIREIQDSAAMVKPGLRIFNEIIEK